MFSFLKNVFGPSADFKAIAAQGALILDVRTPEEFRGGHIKGSLNIPVQVLQNKIADLKKKGKPIIAVCRSGARSGMAADMLKSAGIEAYNGGAWDSLEHNLSH